MKKVMFVENENDGEFETYIRFPVKKVQILWDEHILKWQMQVWV